jgi:hypothetical protein
MRLSVLRLEDLAGDIHMKISFVDETSQWTSIFCYEIKYVTGHIFIERWHLPYYLKHLSIQIFSRTNSSLL